MIYRFFSLKFDDGSSLVPIDNTESAKFLLPIFVNLTNESRWL